MKMIFLVLVFLLGGLWKTEALSETGMAGKEVTIRCSHSYASTNVKYFCKGACDEEDILVRSSKHKDSNGKYSIKDEGNTFTVTISGLTEDDSGTYWCGIERVGVDTYNEVVLTVIKEDSQSNSNTSSFNKLVYIGACLGVVLLALSVVLLLVFRHRNRYFHASPGLNDGAADVTVSPQKQEKGNLTSANKHQVQLDDLLYTTVSFSKHSDDSTDTPGAELTYSTVKHKATDKSLYCKVPPLH
ncbi:CMRF35-like molecule 1 isoform X1 [Gasterosteus aculeatus]